jgi:hypothetical protein
MRVPRRRFVAGLRRPMPRQPAHCRPPPFATVLGRDGDAAGPHFGQADPAGIPVGAISP